jgi:hypothetical protein
MFHLCCLRMILCAWHSFLGTLPRQDSFPHVPHFSIFIWCGCFSPAQCVEVSQLIYAFDIDLKGSRFLFTLCCTGRGIVSTYNCYRCWELTLVLCTFWSCTLSTVIGHSHNTCLLYGLFSLFTFYVIFHIVSNMKFIYTYIHVWILLELWYLGVD